jgi:polar amino acid transport system substrate-binding protein
LATIVAVSVLGVLTMLIAGCGSSGGQGSADTSPTTEALISERNVVELVDTTCAAIEKDAAGTLAAINSGEPPYTDPANPGLYAFVYDTQVTLVATPDASVRGQSMKGKPDAAGKMFRDEIVGGALAMGSGWVEYAYEEPGKEGLFLKATHFKLATGSDGQKYVVCAGRYVGPYEGSLSAATPAQTEVQAFVAKAVAYAGEKGKEAALAAFTAPGGEFHQGQLYIYAYDFSGTVIAHGGDATLVGKNLIGMKDPNGVPVIQELVRLAKQGSGWLYYTWPNPEHGNSQEPKLGYVMKVDDTWFLGSGAYGPAAVKPPSEAEVQAFVDEAQAYAKEVGQDKAIAAFMDTGGRFFRGQLYIFAYDYTGKVLCLPAEPQKLGEDRWNLQDSDGVYFVREFIEVAKNAGAGWVNYKYVNPAQGYAVQPKTSYIRKVDDIWLLGAGTYQAAD